jgi:hypothetical protein
VDRLVTDTMLFCCWKLSVGEGALGWGEQSHFKKHMRSSAKSGGTGFTFRLDQHSGVPVYRQLIDQVQAAIATGAVSVGDQLPTVRRVAVDLAINPNTVVRAYREMEIDAAFGSQS